ncbi:unnamed protein product [Closterium sp. Naga37s-1]|nr:unnamed protein product [Closterium sp. Naga37s-1]
MLQSSSVVCFSTTAHSSSFALAPPQVTDRFVRKMLAEEASEKERKRAGKKGKGRGGRGEHGRNQAGGGMTGGGSVSSALLHAPPPLPPSLNPLVQRRNEELADLEKTLEQVKSLRADIARERQEEAARATNMAQALQAQQFRPPRLSSAPCPATLRVRANLPPRDVRASASPRVVSNALTALEAPVSASPAAGTAAAINSVVQKMETMGLTDTSLVSTNEHRAWVASACVALGALFARGVVTTVDDASVTAVLGAVASAAGSYLLADFGTGVYHFGVDNYGDSSTPIFGPQIDAFQGHHKRPWTITKRQFANNLHALAKPILFSTLPFIFVLPHSAEQDIFFSVFLASVMFSQLFHAWSHTPRVLLPPFVPILQDAGLLVSRKMHGAHHRPPYNANYCIVSGACNPLLDSIGFFSGLEKFIFQTTGVPSRSWSETAPEWLEEGGYYEDGSDEQAHLPGHCLAMASLTAHAAASVASYASASRTAATSAAAQQTTMSCSLRTLPSSMSTSSAASSSATPFFQGARLPSLKATTRAAATPASKSGAVQVRAGEIIEVELERPYGLKFYRGEDGAIYIDALYPGQSGLLSKQIQEGDKVLATSAVFGGEMWPAAEYSRVMYTVRQRVGTLLVRLEKMGGQKIGPWKKDKYLEERAAGNYGDAIREKQMENAALRQEQAEERVAALDKGLQLYKAGKYEEAMQKFQTIIGLVPSYREEAVAFYNIACCCSKLKKVEGGLQALEAAMEAGFDDYKKIRQDPDLSFVRDDDEFDELMDRYDEPIINENAIKALTSVFGFFGKK